VQQLHSRLTTHLTSSHLYKTISFIQLCSFLVEDVPIWGWNVNETEIELIFPSTPLIGVGN
jgi:hypothetical protein